MGDEVTAIFRGLKKVVGICHMLARPGVALKLSFNNPFSPLLVRVQSDRDSEKFRQRRLLNMSRSSRVLDFFRTRLDTMRLIVPADDSLSRRSTRLSRALPSRSRALASIATGIFGDQGDVACCLFIPCLIGSRRVRCADGLGKCEDSILDERPIAACVGRYVAPTIVLQAEAVASELIETDSHWSERRAALAQVYPPRCRRAATRFHPPQQGGERLVMILVSPNLIVIAVPNRFEICTPWEAGGVELAPGVEDFNDPGRYRLLAGLPAANCARGDAEPGGEIGLR